MGEYKTPGVYIKEKNAFGNSVVEAETAIPAFIGITEKALNGSDDLTNIPWKISSMTEFVKYFGGMPALEMAVDIKKFYYLTPEQMKAEKKLPDGKPTEPTDALFIHTVRPDKETEEIELAPKEGGTGKPTPEQVPVGYAFCMNGTNPYTLYYQMQMFFANGGGTCYVVSIGKYGEKDDKGNIVVVNKDKVLAALDALKLEREVTMIVVPEAAGSDLCANIQQEMMKHCGEMANRFAILDVPHGDKSKQLDKRMETFQDTVTNYLSYGAAYYPWLNTSVLSERDLTGSMFDWTDNALLLVDKFASNNNDALPGIINSFFTSKIVLFSKDNEDKKKEQIVNGHTFKFEDYNEKDFEELNDKKLIYDSNQKKIGQVVELQKNEVTQKKKENEGETVVVSITLTVRWFFSTCNDKSALHQALCNGSAIYKLGIKAILHTLNCLPPSAAMAGLYTMVDSTRGVWKAPANVSLNYVASPAEDIDDDEQANLNAPMNGKAINVIRTFRGEGVKVWGARTLDGNSLDWRYINVRRTLLFLEESVRNAARAYVFEPNDAGTWINMKCMIENFLRSVWKRGGLAGATPEDAFEVHVGLGDTMTGEDILEGIMRITVLVAVTHPAEFIEITFQQQMQKS